MLNQSGPQMIIFLLLLFLEGSGVTMPFWLTILPEHFRQIYLNHTMDQKSSVYLKICELHQLKFTSLFV